VTVRRAASAHAAGIAALLDQLGYPASEAQVRARLERLDAVAFVAVDGGEAVGLAAVQVMHVLERRRPRRLPGARLRGHRAAAGQGARLGDS
jgi:hypothetical protein